MDAVTGRLPIVELMHFVGGYASMKSAREGYENILDKDAKSPDPQLTQIAPPARS